MRAADMTAAETEKGTSTRKSQGMGRLTFERLPIFHLEITEKTDTLS